ncbi:MAG: hypothetical protein J2P15_06275 [Micromonosporaceae bacterium]|nr:hypothetical protein [Micromonosporaceae bacterium]
MSDTSALSLALLRRVADFLDSLAEDHIADLAEGRARLTYVPWGDTEPVPPRAPQPVKPRAGAAKPDPTAIAARLGQAGSRDEGRQLLQPLGVAALRAVAKAVGMTGVSKTPKAELIDDLVALTVGSRLGYAAMREG